MKDGRIFRGALQAASAPSILLFEKDGGLRKSIYLTLQQHGLQVQESADASGVRKILEEKKPDLFVIDQESSKGVTGDLIEMFRSRCNEGGQAVVVTTTQRVDDSWREAYKPDMVLYKPFDIRFLYRKIIKLLHQFQTDRQQPDQSSSNPIVWQ